MLGYPPPPQRTEFLTHACENITFSQLLLRVVKMTNIKEIFAFASVFVPCEWTLTPESQLSYFELESNLSVHMQSAVRYLRPILTRDDAAFGCPRQNT